MFNSPLLTVFTILSQITAIVIFGYGFYTSKYKWGSALVVVCLSASLLLRFIDP